MRKHFGAQLNFENYFHRLEFAFALNYIELLDGFAEIQVYR